MTNNSREYRPFEEYLRAAEVLRTFTGGLLIWFSEPPLDTRRIILRNFIARGNAILTSILHLWQIENFDDCWTLYRALLDRLFHVKALAEMNSFDVFEKWSFIRQMEANSRAVSDPDVARYLDERSFRPTSAQQKRYEQLKREQIRWKRPKAEDVAKSLGLGFLYKYGYDYASMRVHPMANDGECDYVRLIGRTWEQPFDQRMILSNAFLAQILLTQQGMGASGLEWRGVVLDFINRFLEFLGTGSQEYVKVFSELMGLGPEVAWARCARS